MDFDRLRTFLRVAEVGSLSGASDVLRIAQPALSRQIRLLESEVGRPLFTRSHTGMHLTPAGQDLRDRVSGLIRQLEQSVEEVRGFDAAPSGIVTIGIVPTVAIVIAQALVTRVRADLPDVKLRLTEGYTGHIIDWLYHRDVDIGVIYGPAVDLHLDAKELASDELVLIAPAQIPLPDGPLDHAHLGRWPMILPVAPHGLRLVIDRAAKRAGVTLNITTEASSFLTMLQLVTAGIGVTLQPRSIIPRYVAGTALQIRTFSPPLARQVVLAHPPGALPTRAAQSVADIVQQESIRLLR